MKARAADVGRSIATVLWLAASLAGRAQAPAAADPFPAAVSGNPEAAATLVIYNDTGAESGELARFYAEKRGIPAAHLLPLQCSPNEEISREEYDRTIVEPVRRAFTTNFWWKLREPDSPLGPVESNRIRFVVLMRGMPLKIAGTTNYPGDHPTPDSPVASRNEAAIDSELASVGFFTRTISGAANNPYFRSFTRITDLRRPELMLVCRLDGPSAATVRQMIVDGLAAEREGLAGFAYIDARGLEPGPYREGDDWMFAAATNARRLGLPVILDNGPDIFPESYPMRRAALYYGWYAGEVAGPFARPGFRFARGAVGVHLHSFSGATVRDPRRAWVGPLLAAGAAATLGNVYEPYLTLTPHLDVFQNRLAAGFTFAEAAYMSQRVLSWMTTCVGDPLYRPFKGAEMDALRPSTGEWAEYRSGASLWFAKDPATGAAALNASGKKLRSGIIFEGLGLLELTRNAPAAAIEAFQQARRFYENPEDIARVALHELTQLRLANRHAEAVALARKLVAANPRAIFLPLLRAFDPPPSPPTTPGIPP
jgi:uncharacterized protein (TIGR03790 family)